MLPIYRALLWMTGALVSFTLMALAVRELHASGVPSFQIVFCRSLAGLCILSAIAWKMKLSVRSRQTKLQILRNTIHYGGQFSWVFALSLLPLAEVFAIEFTIPIWVAIIAVLVLHERMTRGRAAAIGCGFIGILIILQPGIKTFDPAALVPLACAMCFAGSIICTKLLLRTDSPFVILFQMNIIQLPIGVIPALLVWTTPSLTEVALMTVVGLCALTAHYSLASAFQNADVIVVTPLEFLRLPLIAVLGLLIYDEPFEFALLIGAVLIFAGNYYNVTVERRANRREPAPGPNRINH